jgi:hypothetical protein
MSAVFVRIGDRILRITEIQAVSLIANTIHIKLTSGALLVEHYSGMNLADGVEKATKAFESAWLSIADAD